ncbi:helix-turn-helix domain-containing protein [Neobacillus pocheonensis]|uniref:Helix-turn-helix domain-containing protein n=1 Tax=Neobacillus pocheonensis TaxID=363869 RepID=A0ABT0WHR8_9BACI|nr:helix-turn-helix domain-containing protein [Neobacillus pocheonensis]
MKKETMYIGEIIKRLRFSKQFNQEELAFRSGLGRTIISYIETNVQAPSLSTTFALAKGFGIKASELIKEIEDNPELIVLKEKESKNRFTK